MPTVSTRPSRPRLRMLRKRWVIISIVSVVLAILVVTGIRGVMFLHNLSIAAPPTIQVSISTQALNNLIAENLATSQNSVSGLSIVPLPANGLQIRFNLNINSGGIHRVLPLEIDATLGGSTQQKDFLTIQHFKRDGVDESPQAVTRMQTTLNQLLQKALPLLSNTNTVSIGQLLALAPPIKQSQSPICGRGSMLFQVKIPVLIQPHQVIPVEIDGDLGLDTQHILLLHLERVTYNGGKDAGSLAVTIAGQLLDQALIHPPSPSDSNSSSKLKVLFLGTNTQVACGQNAEMLVFQLGGASS